MRPAAGKSNYDQSGSSKLGEDAWPNIIIVQFTQISRSDAGRCPLWVKSRHRRTSNQCPLYPQKRTLELSGVMSALCQKRTFSEAFRHIGFVPQRTAMQLAAAFSLIPDAINRGLALGRHHLLGTQEARDEVATTRDRFFAPLSRVYITFAQHIPILC